MCDGACDPNALNRHRSSPFWSLIRCPQDIGISSSLSGSVRYVGKTEENRRNGRSRGIDTFYPVCHRQQVEDEPCNYIIRGTPDGVKYFGELEGHCFWGNEVKLYEHHVDKLFAMFWHKKPKIKYYVCTINKTFAKQGQRMVEYTEDRINEEDDTLPLKLGDGTVSCDSRFILGTDKRATITTNWS